MHNKGLILISVLIFINLIILLVTIGFTISELQLRMSNNQLQHTQVTQAAQFGLQAARKLLQQHPLSCQIPLQSTYDLSTKSAAWWHSAQICHGKFGKQNYYYVVEPLQINNCLYFDGSSAVKYWRITVRAEQAAGNKAVAILQETVALPTKETGTCPTTRYKLTSYEQSWRQLR
jgi:Tfp pilus assembly protein PilX